ncbi:MAG: phospholipid carrier-dependent glycosyltransferase, partial [Bacteroides sp.]|nr:phospholipid carrier-dependent glycosyltransferase [Bacteroides sp.]
LLIVCFFTFFIHNDVLYTDIMESRNIVTAREMVYEGNWIIPTMNGELQFASPLSTWIAAVV